MDGPQRVEFHDVLVGDVWLCGGQSNMEMGLSRVRNGNDEIAAADHTRIRLFVVRQRGAKRAGGGTARVMANLLTENHRRGELGRFLGSGLLFWSPFAAGR